jgi:hypothetical protein
MKKQIFPDEIAELEQKLECSSLDKDTIIVMKGLITGQAFLLDLFTRLIQASGYGRLKIIKEIAKVLEIDLIRKSRDESKNSSEGETQGEEQNQFDPKTNEDETSAESEEVNEEASPNDETKEDDSKKNHPKRGNDEFNPVASHVHFHNELEPGDKCPACLQGKVYSFREKIIPILIGRSPLAFEEHRLQTLRCNTCGATFEPKLPQEIPRTGHSMASAQAILTVMHYQIGVPFASISALQGMAKQNVSPSQLWAVIEQAASTVWPISEELRRQAANSKIFYTDDTSARILSYYSENEKNRQKKKRKKTPEERVGTYSSAIIGCTFDGHEIYLFYHGRKYAGENFADLLRDRDVSLKTPIQMKDASTMNVPATIEVIEAKCNAHAIRKFKDLRDIYPKECAEVLRRYGDVGKNEQMSKKHGKTDQERFDLHKKKSFPLMEGIKSYLDKLINNRMIEPNSTLGAAIAYFQSHYKELIAFCKIEGAPFDNNKAERALKMIIRLRKTSMFYKTDHGAEVAGILHSVLYTAQEAGINVLDYLQTILENKEEVSRDPTAFLPWTFQTGLQDGVVEIVQVSG